MGIFSKLLGRGVSTPKVGKVENGVYKVDVALKANHAITSTKGLQTDQCQDYFREILQTEFPEYTFKENIAVTELVGELNDSFQLYKTRPYQAYKAEWGRPYNFVLYKKDKLVATIMLGEKWTQHNKVKFLISKMYMKKIGVAYIPFYTELANDIGYVVNRIQNSLQ